MPSGTCRIALILNPKRNIVSKNEELGTSWALLVARYSGTQEFLSTAIVTNFNR